MTEAERVNNTFADVDQVERLLGELAGAASICWDPKPDGVFESVRAGEFVDHAVARLSQLIGISGDLANVTKQKIEAAQSTYCLDLWMALGLPVDEFYGYFARNRFGNTWPELLRRVRDLASVRQCDRNVWCVLHEHSLTTPCHEGTDVGAGEPLPDGFAR